MVGGLFGNSVQDATISAAMLDPELEKTVPLVTIEEAAKYTNWHKRFWGMIASVHGG